MRVALGRLLLLATALAAVHARVVKGKVDLSPQQPFKLLAYFAFDVSDICTRDIRVFRVA